MQSTARDSENRQKVEGMNRSLPRGPKKTTGEDGGRQRRGLHSKTLNGALVIGGNISLTNKKKGGGGLKGKKTHASKPYDGRKKRGRRTAQTLLGLKSI